MPHRRAPRRGPSNPLERVALRARRTEQRRLRWHFAETLAWLERNEPIETSPVRAAARRRSLAALAAYALEGRFPRARDPLRFGPIFVDDDGRRCAMGHLLEVHGAAALVDRIRSTTNLAYLHDLAGDAELAASLEVAGLSLDEAARIQPGYWCTPAELCLCSTWFMDEHSILYEGIVEALGPGDGGGGAGGAVDGGGAGGGGDDVPPGMASFRIVAVHGTGEARVGDLVVGRAAVYDGQSSAVGDHLLLSSSFDPYYAFPEPTVLDTTLCQRVMGDFENVPAAAPAAAAIDNILGRVACGEGLPPEWVVEYYDCDPGPGASGAGGATGATTATTNGATGASTAGSSSGGGEGGERGEGGATVAEDELAGGRGGCGACTIGPGGTLDGALAVGLVLGGALWRRRTRRGAATRRVPRRGVAVRRGP